ncbi:MAG: leucine--tRNA ligase [Patescibacteria group bacterium]
MSKYQPKKIESKWQKYWQDHKSFLADDNSSKPKYYCLDMFPYPSAHGLHVGHPEGYTATDIISRYKRMQGFNVMHPMGWDAFGLPAENFAIKTGVHPKKTTTDAIKTFTKQIKSLGFSYDWDREINTSSSEYYKWTQWIFLQLYKNGLAYKKKASVNWCESCKTVLANEQVANGKCERCQNDVIQKDLEQWFFKTTNYAERLLNDLENLDWPEPIKLMQKNWIGKSEGSEIKFSILDSQFSINVFTTRADTLYGATYMVLAPEHELVEKLKGQITNFTEVEKYIKQARAKSDLQRTELQKEKTGVCLQGILAVNPANKKSIPVYIADYVLASYGTGAIMAVPAHDERDWDFAKKYNIEIIKIIDNNQIDEKVYCGEGKLINSAEFNNINWQSAKKKITEKVGGKITINYKLRDWLISRQRYWGAPIPIIYCEKCGAVAVPEEQLPVVLPEDVDFKPTGESPLKYSKTFHEVSCPSCGATTGVRRENDTMDTFVCSSWYYLRYCDPKNSEAFADNDKLKKWLPVDLYVGGAEHACMHLIYARFFYKVLKDLGYINIEEKIDHNEPFSKLKNQGMILGEDHQKMSKSRGNVINPDDVVNEYGADTLRLYEMFMGAFEDVKPWDTNSIKGVFRFLDRVWNFYNINFETETNSREVDIITNQTIKKVSEDLENFKFNTALSQLMICLNKYFADLPNQSNAKQFIKLLYPFAPHIASEIAERFFSADADFFNSWPEYNPAFIINDNVEIIIQINGKVRDKLIVPAGDSENQKKIEQLALSSVKVKSFLNGQKPKKIIFIKGKLMSLVV